MANVSHQSFLVFLVGMFLCTSGTIATFSNLHFPFAHLFRNRLINSDNDGDHINLNVTFNDNDNLIASYETRDLENWAGSACARECNDKLPPRICYYAWTLEFWNVLGPACRGCQNGFYSDCYRKGCVVADGVERGLLTVNRQLPGPPIHVCKNDIIVVDVKNRMAGNDETIHWHGVLQHSSPWMDGVPYVTQCPIRSDSTMRYAFVASKTDIGTNFYHSHTGHHKVNGIYGALIIRDSRQADPNSHTYECDDPRNTMLISDWFHTPAENLSPGLQNMSQVPVSYLINGRGPYRDPMTNQRTKVPLSVFRVNPTRCASNRFRIINSDSSVCPVQIQIERHRPKVIALDSYSIKPVDADSLYSAAGERIDFVLPTEQPGPNTEYWIVVTARGVCQGRNLQSFAVLSYADESVADDDLAIPARPYPDAEYPKGITLNKANTVCGGQDYCPSDLEDADEVLTREQKQKLIHQEPDEQVVLAFNNYPLPNVEAFHYEIYHSISNIGRRNFVGAVNNITLTYSHISLDTQTKEIVDDGGEIDRQTFCDSENLPTRCKGFAQCPCTHRVKFKKGSVVDLIMVDDTQQAIPLAHPFHLHGHGFYVKNQYSAPPEQPINAEIVREAVKDGTFDRRFGQSRRSGIDYGNPCKKDTTQIPSKGLAVLRVLFDNPGFWIMHCHIDWHLGIGMAFIIQVGEFDEFKSAPKTIPQCRDYKPSVVLD